MKETVNYSLTLYEITKVIDVDKIDNKVLKLFVTLAMFPVLLLFILMALGIEEPLKCIFSLILFKTTPKKAWDYYKKCWGSLFGGYKSVS